MTTGPGSGSPPPDEGDDATFADVLNGFTLDSGRGRRKRKKAREAEADKAPPPEQDEAAQQASPPPARTPETLPPPPARPEFEPNQGTGLFEPPPGTGLFEPAVNSGPLRPEPGFGEEETAVVRPYALTGGRTKASYLLELETLISVKDGADARLQSGTAPIEHHSIVEECRTPRSVAEVAALLRVPVGVARVLISDAADAGLVTVHKTVSGNDNAEAHLMLMERVLSGLRRL
ncbi:DUF742 domain-containing protein [Amycolatopsis acidicola]|uniref:DUF742 domain-containing protein n=1 Tax=Amycolatopsis acidicola TaxID=2596893 RepID=A0A5N0V1K6_9PSEU|nr:DUF742 domain-containing protein [Amycolatopsis acidicola]KAA9158394.1 DUF742 domain-containing protein [Amycolatopsis acidicola]